ncbi:MAG: D-2-hydroxyacid dehydrogenase [Chloroflexota bacterium]|nr:D-2-hydroxyacid dehydrogenase [Chloroflexota bacterium]
MKIVCLDGHTLNPGDLSWDAVRALGEFELYDYTEPDQTVERAKDADIILTNKVIISRAIMDQLPKLKMISVLATGYDIIDIRAASDRNIPVCNVPSYGSYSVAQMVFAHILNFTQRVAYHAETVKQGRWLQSKDFCYWDYPLIELHGKTMGIVGFGRIGRSTAAIAKGFGMKVLAHDIYVTKTDDENVTLVDLETLFRESDFISLHTLLTDQTRGMVNAELLGKMKETAFLINTSRGPVINEADLYEALKNGQLAGAGLDVSAEEPTGPGNPLLELDNCVITPHISWATAAARGRLMQTTVDNIEAFQAGKPINVVS